MVLNLISELPLEDDWSPINFRSCQRLSNHWSSFQVLFTQYLISLCLMVTKLTIPVGSRKKIFWVTTSRSNYCSSSRVLQTQYFMHCISFIVTKLGTVVATREWIIIIDFSGHKITVKVNFAVSWYKEIFAHWLTYSLCYVKALIILE